MDGLLQQAFHGGPAFHSGMSQEEAVARNGHGVQHKAASQYMQPQQYFQRPTQHGPNMGDDSTDSGDEFAGDREDDSLDYKCKSRRKATEKPEGSDQKRQAFSKRKRGIVLKAYQLYKLTDAKVFMFMVNDKGSSWMYATPGFGASLHPTQLRRLRELAGFVNPPKRPTEVMAHPRLDDHDHQVDDRHLYVGSLEPLRLKCDKLGPDDHHHAGDVTTSAPQPPLQPLRERDHHRTVHNIASMPSASHSTPATAPSHSIVHTAGTARSAGAHSGGVLTSIPNSGMYTGASGGGMLGPIMLGPDGGYVSESMMAQTGQPMTQVVNMTHMTSSSTGLVDTVEQTITIPFSQDQSHTNTTQANAALTGQVLTDGQGNMYRIVHEAPDHSPPPQPPQQYVLQPGMDGQPPPGAIMMQPTMMMMPSAHSGHTMSGHTTMTNMRAVPVSAMGPTAPHRPIKMEGSEPSNMSGMTTQAGGASDSPRAKSNKRRVLEGVVSEEYHHQHVVPANVIQSQSTLSLDNNSNGPVYVQAGGRMATYVTSGQYGPGQLVQMSGPQQHMGGYTMAMPQDVQGFRSYPAGQVMMMAQDGWRPGNMGGQGVTVRQVPEQQWQQ